MRLKSAVSTVAKRTKVADSMLATRMKLRGSTMAEDKAGIFNSSHDKV